MIYYIYVQPNSQRTEYLEDTLVDAMKYGIPGGSNEVTAMKIKLAAVPSDGAANKELIKFLAQHFKVSKTNIRIKKGEKSRYKVVEI